MQKVRRLRVGDLVQVPIIWDDRTLEWIGCNKIGIVLAIDEDEPCDANGKKIKYDPDCTFITIMMDGEVYGHEYYERDLTIIGRSRQGH
jgi:hypothetical protein